MRPAARQYPVRNKDVVCLYDVQAEYEKMQAIIRQDIVENAPDKVESYIKAFLEYVDSLADGSVWYMISDLYGKYYIALFYDNLHNRSNGEDL